MAELIKLFHAVVLENLANFGVVIFECIGVCVTIWEGINAFIKYIKKDKYTGIYLARGLSMGLMFKMGSEILRTVTAHDLASLAVVAATMIVRAAMSVLLHWEMAKEEKHEKETGNTTEL